MFMRNRRVRLLLLAIVLTIIFVAYSRSDPTTIEGAKKYAQQTYRQAYDQTIGKSKSQPSNGQADKSFDPIVPEVKKDEPFRVDFGAYSKAAAANAEETTAPVNIPPPAAPVPQPPAEPKVQAPAPVEAAKKDDPMRVDFAAYSKAAVEDPEETAPAGLKSEVIANPNPIAGVGVGDVPAPKPALKAKPAEQGAKSGGSVQPVGEGRVEIDVEAAPTGQPVHWSKRSENFPPTSTIPFPHADSTPIPKIQYDFKKAGRPGEDAEKLAVIKAAAVHSWKGYREKAMGHDEVKPISGKFANPFNAWGATLVDSLDTLWLMGMRPEFEEALEWVKKIDFTTSKRSDIPVFETTIRYMGGLLGAYEISSHKYKVLLDQAAQLGEILYGAFDTPNRMPMTYYQWKPAFTSQGHRARSRTILAEIGSLSLEFTRLGQLVDQSKYYDAIARITNALEEWQPKTRIPGLWPTTVNASGCKKATSSKTDDDKIPDSKAATKAKADTKAKNVDPDAVKPPTSDPRVINTDSGSAIGGSQPGLGKIAHFGNAAEEGSLDKPSAKDSLFHDAGISKIVKRALDTLGVGKDAPLGVELPSTTSKGKASTDLTSNSASSGNNKEETRSTTAQAPIADEEPCTPQGLGSTQEDGSDVFSFGAAADSTYEYLPKMHMLLGGKTSQYERMYKKAIEASKKWLVFRAMTPDENRELFFTGNVDTVPNSKTGEMDRDFKPVMSHLTCFVGGMFAVSGKIFNNPEDVDLGAKLTDGCIWAYNSTTTGIMPELFGLHKCESTVDCKWDQKAYYRSLDPDEENRLRKKKPKTSDHRDIAASGRDALEKRQFGGGEMQYGLQAAPDTLSAEAAARIAETPTRDMGHSGFSSAYTPEEVSIKNPYDAGASPKLPADAQAITAAGAANAAPYPAAPDAYAKVPATVQDSKDKPAVPEVKAGGASTKDTFAPAGDTKSDSSLANKKIAPDVPSSGLAPTLSDPDKSDSGLTNKKIAPDVPDSGLAPTLSDTETKSGGGSTLSSKNSVGSDPETVPLTGSSHKSPTSQGTSARDPLPHEEFVKDKIKSERIPAGMTAMYGKQYLLRPEAIESVFYMYRITGNQYWRDRGWEMWQAISKYTAAPYGATAIEDVSTTKPEPHDSEESFWLAETLKYFYLLFDDPDRYSLDDWVLNTEAHFFSRPGV